MIFTLLRSALRTSDSCQTLDFCLACSDVSAAMKTLRFACKISVLLLTWARLGYSKIPLYILSLQELTNIPFWYEVNTLVPGVANLTLERINNNTDILQDYELNIIHGDIQVMKQFLK